MAFETVFTAAKSQRKAVGSDLLARRLLYVVDAALAGCVFVVPLMFGGRQASGQFMLTLLAVAAALAWWMRQCLLPRQYWRRSSAYLLLFAAVGLVAFQLVPLPESWLVQLTPKTADLLPLWGGDTASAGLDSWRYISLTPAASRAGLVLMLAYAMIFWVTVQRVRSMEDVERLLRWTAYSALGMATFGLLQYAFSNEKFFWVHDHPFALTSDGAKGAFTNRNHFAQFLALGLGPVIWWVQDGLRRRGATGAAPFRTAGARIQSADLDIGLRVAGLVIVLVAVLMSLSRGGAIVAAVAALVSLAVCYRAGALRGKFALGLAAVALLMGVALLAGDQDSLGGRLEGLASGSIDRIDENDGRRTIWKATAAAIPDFLWFGSGSGSFAEVYPMYLPHRAGANYYTHAENGYLQVTLENGLVGLILVILAILVCLFWAGRGMLKATSSRMFVAAGATAAAMVASIVHSGVDFVWYTPGCLVPALIMAACACRIRQFTHDEAGRRRDRIVLPRPVAWAAVPLTIILGAWMLASQIGTVGGEKNWITSQRLLRAAALNPPTVVMDETPSLFPEDPSVVAAREEDARRQIMAAGLQNEQRMVAELIEAVRWDPNNARAQLALSRGYMQLFQFAQEDGINQMPLSQIRDAAIAARYSSREELDEWLQRAVGEHYHYLYRSLEHAKAAVTLCPLLGEGYLHLGELCFLEGATSADKSAFVEQALRVRPYDGTVQFHAGREALLAGRFDEGIEHWRKAFHAGPIYQRQVIDLMVGRTIDGALDQEIAYIIAEFQPDLEGLKYMYHRYRDLADERQLTPLLTANAQAAQDQAQADFRDGRPELAARRWLDAMGAYEDLAQPRNAAACAQQAIECNPNDFDARYKLGCLLADMGRLTESEEQLKWCIRAKPGHIPVKRKLKEVNLQLLDPGGFHPRRSGKFYPPSTEFLEASLHVPGPSTLPVTPTPLTHDALPTGVYRR